MAFTSTVFIKGKIILNVINKKQELIKSIEKCFSCSPVCAEVISHSGPILDEPKEVERFFKGKSWCDIELNSMLNEFKGPQDASFSFMTHEAKRYYLPLFLKICIKDYEDCDTIYESTMSSLVNRPGESFPFEKYTEQQKLIVADCLKYFAELNKDEDDYFNDALIALNSYWNNI